MQQTPRNFSLLSLPATYFTPRPTYGSASIALQSRVAILEMILYREKRLGALEAYVKEARVGRIAMQEQAIKSRNHEQAFSESRLSHNL